MLLSKANLTDPDSAVTESTTHSVNNVYVSDAINRLKRAGHIPAHKNLYNIAGEVSCVRNIDTAPNFG